MDTRLRKMILHSGEIYRVETIGGVRRIRYAAVFVSFAEDAWTVWEFNNDGLRLDEWREDLREDLMDVEDLADAPSFRLTDEGMNEYVERFADAWPLRINEVGSDTDDGLYMNW